MKKKNYRTNVRTDKHGGTIERMENVIARWKGNDRWTNWRAITGTGANWWWWSRTARTTCPRAWSAGIWIVTGSGWPPSTIYGPTRSNRPLECSSPNTPVCKIVFSLHADTDTRFFIPGATVLRNRGTGGIFCLLDFGIEIFKEREIWEFWNLKKGKKKEEIRDMYETCAGKIGSILWNNRLIQNCEPDRPFF